MKPLRDFLRNMMERYPYDNHDSGTCKDDFAALCALVITAQNPASVARRVAEVRSAAKQKESPRALLATFGSLAQGRRLLELSDTQAQGTLENLKHIGALDEVASKAVLMNQMARSNMTVVESLHKMIDATIELLDNLLSAQRACVSAAQDLIVDTQKNASYMRTLSEAQEAVAELIRSCLHKHMSMEFRPWLSQQIELLKQGQSWEPAPDFKIKCFANTGIKKLGCRLQEVPDLTCFYKASHELASLTKALASVMMVSDDKQTQRTTATRACTALQEWINSEKALTVSFRDIHTLTTELKELLIAHVTKLCSSAWRHVMQSPSSVLATIMQVGWGRSSMAIEQTDLTSAIDACSDACLLSTGFRCTTDAAQPTSQHSDEVEHAQMSGIAMFVKCVIQATSKMCDANVAENALHAQISRAEATKLIRAALVSAKLLKCEPSETSCPVPVDEESAELLGHVLAVH